MISAAFGPVAAELSSESFPNEVCQNTNLMLTAEQCDTASPVSDDDLGNYLHLRVPNLGEVGDRADAGRSGHLPSACDTPAVEALPRVVEVLRCLQSAHLFGILYCDAMLEVPSQGIATSDTVTSPVQKTRPKLRSNKPWRMFW